MQKTLSHHEKQRLKKIALTERKRALVLERFCFENGRSDKERSSLRDIGKQFGYSHTHIRSLRNRFLKAKHYHRFGVPYTKYTKIEGYTLTSPPRATEHRFLTLGLKAKSVPAGMFKVVKQKQLATGTELPSPNENIWCYHKLCG